jgi:hypothetical protein
MDKEKSGPRWLGIRVEVFEAAALAMAYGQYHAVEVYAEIESLRSFTVFVPITGLG